MLYTTGPASAVFAGSGMFSAFSLITNLLGVMPESMMIPQSQIKLSMKSSEAFTLQLLLPTHQLLIGELCPCPKRRFSQDTVAPETNVAVRVPKVAKLRV